MKKILLSLAISMIAITTQAQINQVATENSYLAKSKQQKTTGFILLGAGVTLLSIYTVNLVSSLGDIFSQEPGPPQWMAIVGSGAVVGSIPFFISASKNKKAAASISVDNKTVYLQNNKAALTSQPTVTLRINF